MSLSEATFNTLDHDKNPESMRRYFVEYLLKLLPNLKSNQQASPEIAYSIAGMLSSHFAQTLNNNDPLLEIMIIAGELETSPANSLELTEELIRKIESLIV